MEHTIPRTYGEAIAQGYMDGQTKYQRGYVSRRCNPDEQPVYVAGGNMQGQLYVLLPAYNTTNYCIRQYLTKK